MSKPIELDGQRHAVSPGTAIIIKSGCGHRVIGKQAILSVPVPAFDEKR